MALVNLLVVEQRYHIVLVVRTWQLIANRDRVGKFVAITRKDDIAGFDGIVTGVVSTFNNEDVRSAPG